eukprot:1469308-Amphidinium_carterae.1
MGPESTPIPAPVVMSKASALSRALAAFLIASSISTAASLEQQCLQCKESLPTRSRESTDPLDKTPIPKPRRHSS